MSYSSKITEFDLDPEMDMAKESTSQSILNAVMSGGGVKKIQRGSVTEACTVTIDEVVMEKTFVYSVSKGSAGTVATSGNINMNGTSATFSGYNEYLSGNGANNGDIYYYANSNSDRMIQIYGTTTIPAHTGTISGGTTNLTVAEYSAVLTNSTTLTCDGACEWQVIEYY